VIAALTVVLLAVIACATTDTKKLLRIGVDFAKQKRKE
jgi:hypothetical protein